MSQAQDRNQRSQNHSQGQQPVDQTISDKKITVSVKEVVGAVLFLISLGVSIGGFMSVKSDVDELAAKAEKISDKLDTIGQRIATLEGKLKG